MTFIAFLGLIETALYCALLYYLGVLLRHPVKLRNYLGLKTDNVQYHEYSPILSILDRIGLILIVLAIASLAISIISSVYVVLRF